eukprot:263977-Rhodomonas_salina.11
MSTSCSYSSAISSDPTLPPCALDTSMSSAAAHPLAERTTLPAGWLARSACGGVLGIGLEGPADRASEPTTRTSASLAALASGAVPAASMVKRS